jgi:hypothetical protein
MRRWQRWMSQWRAIQWPIKSINQMRIDRYFFSLFFFFFFLIKSTNFSILSAKRKFLNKEATNKSCRNNFWNKSERKKEKKKRKWTMKMWSKIMKKQYCYKLTSWDGVPSDCICHSSENPVQFTKRSSTICWKKQNEKCVETSESDQTANNEVCVKPVKRPGIFSNMSKLISGFGIREFIQNLW